MVLTVAAIASLLVMAFNVNANSDECKCNNLDNFQNFDDLGQSAECVIVVVGCDGTGSVGSSGDTIIGSGNGNDDNNTNGGDTPLPPIDPTVCEGCIAALGEDVLIDLRDALGLGLTATPEEICVALDAFATIEALVQVLGTELSASVIVDVLDCLGFNLTVAEVIAILEIPEGSI